MTAANAVSLASRLHHDTISEIDCDNDIDLEVQEEEEETKKPELAVPANKLHRSTESSSKKKRQRTSALHHRQTNPKRRKQSQMKPSISKWPAMRSIERRKDYAFSAAAIVSQI